MPRSGKGALLAATIWAASTCFLTIAHASALYDDLGGREGITRIINDLLDVELKDARIKHAFDDTNIDRLKGLLVQQFCELSGGPCHYKGRSMAASHKGLHLTNRDFNALVEDLQIAMDRSNIPFRIQNRLLALLAPMQRDTVTR